MKKIDRKPDETSRQLKRLKENIEQSQKEFWKSTPDCKTPILDTTQLQKRSNAKRANGLR